MTNRQPRLSPGSSTKFAFNPFTGNLDIAGLATYVESDGEGVWVDLSDYATIDYVDKCDQLLQDQIDALNFADTELRDDLDQEIADRIAGDAALNERIDNLVIEAGGVQSLTTQAPITNLGTNAEPIIGMDLRSLSELP